MHPAVTSPPRFRRPTEARPVNHESLSEHQDSGLLAYTCHTSSVHSNTRTLSRSHYHGQTLIGSWASSSHSLAALRLRVSSCAAMPAAPDPADYSANTRRALPLDAPTRVSRASGSAGSITSASHVQDTQDDVTREQVDGVVEDEAQPDWEMPLARLRDLYLPGPASSGSVSLASSQQASPRTRLELENGSASRLSPSPHRQRMSSAQRNREQSSGSSSASPTPAIRDTRPRTSSSLSQMFLHASDEAGSSWDTLAGSPRASRIILDAKQAKPASASNGETLDIASRPASIGLGFTASTRE